MLNQTAMEKVLYDWAKSQVGSIEVVWSRQNEAAPPKPYVALNLVLPPSIIAHDEVLTDADGVTSTRGTREFTMSVNVFGSSAFELMSLMMTSLEFPSVQETFRTTGGFCYIGTSGITDLSSVAELRRETRSQMDVRFRMGQVAIDPGTGWVETVIVTNQATGETVEIPPPEGE